MPPFVIAVVLGLQIRVDAPNYCNYYEKLNYLVMVYHYIRIRNNERLELVLHLQRSLFCYFQAKPHQVSMK